MPTPTVLVIEDNEMDMKLFRALIEISGCKILEAKDAETGLEIALEHCPNLILMDLRLPGLDGFETSRLMKEHETLANIPIILITSYAADGDEQRAKKAGCAAFITKPLDTRSFLRTIARFLS
jgi:two-component system cell cycle response regulator DivK